MPHLKKWVNLSFLGIAVFAWVFLREVFDLIFDFIGWVQPTWIASPAEISGIISGLIIFLGLVFSKTVTHFFTEAYAELAKVTWPKVKESFLSTGVVSVMVAIATLSVLLFDTVWDWIAEKILY